MDQERQTAMQLQSHYFRTHVGQADSVKNLLVSRPHKDIIYVRACEGLEICGK